MPPDREIDRCPGCKDSGAVEIFRVDHVPLHSVRLETSLEAARTVPTGTIRLCFCTGCGLIWNAAFEPSGVTYDSRYESTQSHSGRFSAFHRGLASRLVVRNGLGGKHVVEIGCGQGEFLALLREHGIGRATGFDPASRVPPGGDLEIHSKVFSAADMPGDVDFVCCKMTLEHIPDPLQFLQSVHQGLDGNRDARVFFMVPDATRILAEGAFWDIYHEHVLYFTPEILMRVFHNAGFDVCATESEYEGQYCSVIAKPRSRMRAEAPVEPLSAALTDAAYALDRRVEQAIETWASRLGGNGGTARSTAIWGGGSKAVAFLAALGGRVDIAAVVDINPLKHGTYLPSTGIQVIAPEELRRWAPDQILVMNPIYEAEIRERLSELGVRTKILALR